MALLVFKPSTVIPNGLELIRPASLTPLPALNENSFHLLHHSSVLRHPVVPSRPYSLSQANFHHGFVNPKIYFQISLF